jgi:hypothetical protein
VERPGVCGSWGELREQHSRACEGVVGEFAGDRPGGRQFGLEGGGCRCCCFGLGLGVGLGLARLVLVVGVARVRRRILALIEQAERLRWDARVGSVSERRRGCCYDAVFTLGLMRCCGFARPSNLVRSCAIGDGC